jgi:hypothetical protein
VPGAVSANVARNLRAFCFLSVFARLSI